MNEGVILQSNRNIASQPRRIGLLMLAADMAKYIDSCLNKLKSHYATKFIKEYKGTVVKPGC